MTEEEFLSIWQNQAVDTAELEYRLYYDQQGFPLFYSVEKLPGDYIVVDKETYHNNPKHVRVIDGQIKIIKTVFGKKLAPATQGQACDVRDICVIVKDPDQPVLRWAIKHEDPKDDKQS